MVVDFIDFGTTAEVILRWNAHSYLITYSLAVGITIRKVIARSWAELFATHTCILLVFHNINQYI